MAAFDILKRKKTVTAYKKLFLDEYGQLKPEAIIVINDLYDFARFFKNVPTDPQALAMVEGGRQAVRHILKRTGTTDQELMRLVKTAILGDENE